MLLTLVLTKLHMTFFLGQSFINRFFSMSANIMKMQMFHKMEYDLKGHMSSLLCYGEVDLITTSTTFVPVFWGNNFVVDWKVCLFEWCLWTMKCKDSSNQKRETKLPLLFVSAILQSGSIHKVHLFFIMFLYYSDLI